MSKWVEVVVVLVVANLVVILAETLVKMSVIVVVVLVAVMVEVLVVPAAPYTLQDKGWQYSQSLPYAALSQPSAVPQMCSQN
ncbi:hypothetical protein E2C01_080743 [Portunus trituberculatus]|uniref:Uncharacterized protein n=1 Tax=Portunus trituberculatus TaxID=210409 RepID=A0A5B7IWW6_PORTR|nr:hypothetical protein [Portunus trituberculatus]